MGCCWRHSPVPHSSFTTEEESWQDDPVLLHGATRGYGLYHVNVGLEPAFGFRVWTEYLSVYVWVYLCACVVCAHVCVPSLMQNARGTPNHPVFHPVLFLPYFFFFCAISVICLFLPLSLFLPSGFSEQTPDRSVQTAQPYWSVRCSQGSLYSPKSHCKNFSDSFANK